MADLATAQAKSTLTRAIRAIERRSEAKLVIVVRHKSGPYLAADLLFGIFGGVAALACLLYLPVSFGLATFLLDPIAVGLVLVVVSSRLDLVRRWMTPAALRTRFVCRAARAAFFERGVHRTRAATGVLLYISILERRVELIIDQGVARAVPPVAWAKAVRELQRRVKAEVDVVELVGAIDALGDLLAQWLPREGGGVC